MPATPAWPPASLPRLFVDRALGAGETIVLDGMQTNYLGGVLRLKAGAQVKLFDNRSGEWLAELVDGAKRRVSLTVARRLREREQVPDIWLLFAPVKRGRIDWLVEKATELGVAQLVPVVTQRTVIERVNLERLRAHSIEAAEQCDRTALPELLPPAKLDGLLRDWPAERCLLFADEAGGTPIANVAKAGPTALLIGPEGGFTDAERAAIRAVPQSVPVSLGPRILRADTAAVAAISIWMAAAGDWESRRIR